MADEYKIQIGTEADTKGAVEAEKAIEKLGSAAEKTADAVDDISGKQEKAADSGKDLNKSLESTAQSAEGTRKVVTGLGQLLSGNLLGGVKELTEGFRFLNVAMLANPAGKLVAALSLLAGAWGVVSAAMRGAKKDAKETAEGIEATGVAAEKVAKQISSYERLARAMTDLADQADRYRKITDELTDASVAQQLAATDLAESRGEMTPEAARSRRAGIRVEGQRSKSEATIATAEAEKASAQAQVQEAQRLRAEAESRADRASSDFARRVQEGLNVGAPLDAAGASADNFAGPRAEAERRLELAKATIPDAESGVTHEELIAQAQAELDAVEAVAEAYRKKNKEIAAAEEARAAEAKTTEDASKRAAEATVRSQVAQERAKTAGITSQKEQIDLTKQSEAERKAEREKWLKESMQKVSDIQSVRDLDPDNLDGKGSLRKDVAEGTAEVAQDAAKLKGPSPESTERLKQATAALEDGASGTELDALNQVLERMASALEKRGKDAQKIRDLQSKITRLEGIVERLDNDADT